jgi:hypothetical protein
MAVVTALATVPILLVVLSRPASAAVVRRTGFSATVAGWHSWYGSYGMAAIGDAWCVDHGIPAPDAAYDYGPAVLGERAVATRTAIAWASGGLRGSSGGRVRGTEEAVCEHRARRRAATGRDLRRRVVVVTVARPRPSRKGLRDRGQGVSDRGPMWPQGRAGCPPSRIGRRRGPRGRRSSGA